MSADHLIPTLRRGRARSRPTTPGVFGDQCTTGTSAEVSLGVQGPPPPAAVALPSSRRERQRWPWSAWTSCWPRRSPGCCRRPPPAARAGSGRALRDPCPAHPGRPCPASTSAASSGSRKEPLGPLSTDQVGGSARQGVGRVTPRGVPAKSAAFVGVPEGGPRVGERKLRTRHVWGTAGGKPCPVSCSASASSDPNSVIRVLGITRTRPNK